ncbi:MAG: DNA primase [Sedimentisphaerales bacterium]|nr:DNA primase [Sedimentisphaerales bacterium]
MAGMFDNSTVVQVQQANDIVDVISEHVSLKRKGREMVGLCPFHDDNRPSLNVNAVKQIFKCFACGAGGDVFKFLQMRENLTFPQAVERLAERAGINIKPLTLSTKANRTEETSQQIDPNKLAKINAWAANYFQQNLYDKKKGKYARDYLARRQISTESIKKWKLGLAVDSPDDLLNTARSKKAQIKLLEPAGLITGQTQDKFVNRLMFTITDVTGRVIGFGGRTLDDTGAKYINSPTTPLFDKSNSLYGLEQARHQIVSTGTAIVVEGYTDCIMAHQFGCTNVVATLGTSFTAGHGRILRRYAKKVILLFDSDVAGIEAANRALDVCLAQRIDIRLASVPEGKDPCDFLLIAGRERFEQLLNEAVDVFQFKWNRLTAGLKNDDTITGKKSAIEEYLQTIAIALWAGNVSPIDRGLIVNRISKIIGLETRQINSELNRRLKQAQRTAGYNKNGKQNHTTDYGQGLFAAAQREVIEVLLNEPKLFHLVKQQITPDTFDVPVYRQIAELLFDTLTKNINTSLTELLIKTESVELGNSIVQLSQTGEEKGNFQVRLTDALDAIERHQSQEKSGSFKIIDDQNKFLRKIYENTGKENPHNVGMI